MIYAKHLTKADFFKVSYKFQTKKTPTVVFFQETQGIKTLDDKLIYIPNDVNLNNLYKSVYTLLV